MLSAVGQSADAGINTLRLCIGGCDQLGGAVVQLLQRRYKLGQDYFSFWENISRAQLDFGYGAALYPAFYNAVQRNNEGAAANDASINVGIKSFPQTIGAVQSRVGGVFGYDRLVNGKRHRNLGLDEKPRIRAERAHGVLAFQFS